MKRTLFAACAIAALATAPAWLSRRRSRSVSSARSAGRLPRSATTCATRSSSGSTISAASSAACRSKSSTRTTSIKPEVGKQKTEKLIRPTRSISSSATSGRTCARLAQAAVDSKTFPIITNAGASQLAGELCSPYVFSTSWNNDQTPQAMGLYMNQKGVKSAFLIGPNYAAGKDMLEGVASTFKGQIFGRNYPWPDQLDFSAELSKARAARPDAIFAFYRRAGAQFVTQYAQSGLKGQIPLYTAFTIDSVAAAAEGSRGRRSRRAAMGARPAERSQQEIRRRLQGEAQDDPSFYGSQTYERPVARQRGEAVKGDLSKKDECAARPRKPTSSRCAATSSSARTICRSRTSICRMR